MSLSGLERATGLARSTVDRITSTLARMGYVRLDGRDVVLAPRLMELGNAYLSALRLPALLAPHADALADELDESVSLAVGDRDGIRFIHQATRRRAMSLSFRIGDLLPAERTAPGPAVRDRVDGSRLAALARAPGGGPGGPRLPGRTAARTTPPRGRGRSSDGGASGGTHGWALDDQLIEPGLVAVSVPVRDPRTGRIACVANVVSHTSRHTATDLRDTLLPRLRAAVAEMERELAPPRPPNPGPPPVGPAWPPGPARPSSELGREFIESLARGLTVLTAFGEGQAGADAHGRGRGDGPGPGDGPPGPDHVRAPGPGQPQHGTHLHPDPPGPVPRLPAPVPYVPPRASRPAPGGPGGPGPRVDVAGGPGLGRRARRSSTRPGRTPAAC